MALSQRILPDVKKMRRFEVQRLDFKQFHV